MRIEMTITKTLDLKEEIITKAEQINTLALVSQVGSIEELANDKIESLFGLFIDLSNDISKCADQISFSLIEIKEK
jgi:hypothetical protein